MAENTRNYIYLDPNSAKELNEAKRQFGLFPVEKLFLPEEWFQFTSIAPRLRSAAIAAKLRAGGEFGAISIDKTPRGEVYKIVIGRRDDPKKKPVGVIDIEDICHLNRTKPELIREEARQLQSFKQAKEQEVVDFQAKQAPQMVEPVAPAAVNPEKQTETVSPAPQDMLRRVRLENAQTLFPLGKTEAEIQEQCLMFRDVYRDFSVALDDIIKAPQGSRNYKKLTPFLNEVSELSTIAQYTLAKNPELFEDFKRHVSDWAGSAPYECSTVITAILMDPTTSIADIGKLLPQCKFTPSTAQRFYSSPNALLYGMDMFARFRAEGQKTSTPGDSAYIKARAQLVGQHGSTFKDVTTGILNSRFAKHFETYYGILRDRDIVAKNNEEVSSRVKTNIMQDGPKWLELEFEGIRKGFTNPKPKLDIANLDALEINF